MVVGVCDRRPHPRGLRQSPRAPSADSGGIRTIGHRWRLYTGVSHCPSRRSPCHPVPGSLHQPAYPGPPICTIASAIPCSSSSIILEGARDLEFQEEGNPELIHTQDYSRCGWTSIAKTPPQVPQEAEGGWRQPTVIDGCMPVPPLELDRGGAEEFRGRDPYEGERQTKKLDSQHEVVHVSTLDFETTMTHSKWCGMLPAMVLRSGTTFSYHLQKSFCLQRSQLTSAPTLYPIPLPTPWSF